MQLISSMIAAIAVCLSTAAIAAPCAPGLDGVECNRFDLQAKAPAGHVMAGEVLLPGGAGPWPVVLLVSGTGRQTRDFEAFEGKYHPHRDIARALLTAGIGVVRFDERNTGASTGDHRTARSADLREDVRIILHQAAALAGVDRRRIFIFGHSEGAIFAMQLADTDPLVAGIALAGAGFKSGRDMTWDQVQVETPRPAGLGDAEFRKLLKARYDEEIAFQESRPSLADLLDYDGAKLAARVRKPVLIIEADQDWQVRPPQGRQLASAMRKAGNRKVRYTRLANVGHLLTFNPPKLTDYKLLASYVVDDRVTRALTTWVLATSNAIR